MIQPTRFLTWVTIFSLMLVSVALGQDEGELLYEADFSDQTAWLTGRLPDLQYDLLDEGYRLRNPGPGAGIGVAPPIDLLVDDFYTEVSFTVNACSSEDSSLLFFTRMMTDSAGGTQSAYVFVIQCSGEYRARPVIGGVPWDTTITGQISPLEVGQHYVMGVRFQGRDVIWSLDGTTIDSFEVEEVVRPNGMLASGAQVGFNYTITAWRVWALDTTGTNITQTDIQIEGDPLQTGELGSVLYVPSLDPPHPITLGLSQPVAAVVSDDDLLLFNTEPEAILPFAGVEDSDYYITMAFTVRHCADDSSVGFVWHADENYENYYAVEVLCNGSYRAYVVRGAEALTLSVGRVVPGPQEFGTSAYLGVYVQADAVWIYYENVLLASFTDETLASGQVGLLFKSGQDGTSMDIVASQIIVFAIE